MADGGGVLVLALHADRDVRECGQGPGGAPARPTDLGEPGGAFPLAILPSFFSSISPFLPATHAITALRASIAGYAGHEYADAMWFLASFILFTAFLGLALRPCWCVRTAAWWKSWRRRSCSDAPISPLTGCARRRKLMCPTVCGNAGVGELKTQEGMIGFDSGRRSK